MKTIIVAEAGVNHNGKLNIAKKLIDEAKLAGADYVKFQTFKAEKLVTKNAKMAAYQVKNLKSNINQYQMLKKLELSNDDHYELIRYCKKKKIKFLSTAFDEDSLKFLIHKCKLDIIKIPSGEINNLPFLEYAGRLKKKIFLSTGMEKTSEISKAIKILTSAGAKKERIIILHCVTDYPADKKTLNLRAISYISNKFKIKTGYSDHSSGITAPIVAVTLGACVIEKHFTLNKKLIGPDHLASLKPKELKDMIKKIRETEIVLGKQKKIISKEEKKNMSIARKSIVAKKNISRGDYFSKENICCKRPGYGISPMKWYSIVGAKAKKNYRKDQLI